MKTLKLVKDTRITLTPQKEYDYFTWDMCLRIFVRLNSSIEWRKYSNKRKKKTSFQGLQFNVHNEIKLNNC